MNINRIPKKRTQIRLEPATLDAIDRAANSVSCTRTDVIVALLTKLHRDLGFAVLPYEAREELTHRMRGNKDATTVVNVRLPNLFIEYFKLNEYNLSQAIRIAAQLYLPNNDKTNANS